MFRVVVLFFGGGFSKLIFSPSASYSVLYVKPAALKRESCSFPLKTVTLVALNIILGNIFLHTCSLDSLSVFSVVSKETY